MNNHLKYILIKDELTLLDFFASFYATNITQYMYNELFFSHKCWIWFHGRVLCLLTTIFCLCFCCTQIAAFSQSACLLTRVPVECVNIFTVMFGAVDCACLYGCNMLPLGL